MSQMKSPLTLRWPAFLAVILSSAQAALLNWLTADQVAPVWWLAWAILVLLIGGMAMGVEAHAPRAGRGAVLLTPLALGFSVFVLGNIGLLGATLKDEESRLVDVFMWALAIVSTLLAGLVGALIGAGLSDRQRSVLGTIRRGDPRKLVAALIAGITLSISILVYQAVLSYDPFVDSASKAALQQCLAREADAKTRVNEVLRQLAEERTGTGVSEVPGQGPIYEALRLELAGAQDRLRGIQLECDALAEIDRAEVNRYTGAKRSNPGSRLPLFQISLVVIGLDVVVCLLIFGYQSPRDGTLELEGVDNKSSEHEKTQAPRTAPQRSEERTAGAAPAKPAP